jgi:hypothetical protein
MNGGDWTATGLKRIRPGLKQSEPNKFKPLNLAYFPIG